MNNIVIYYEQAYIIIAYFTYYTTNYYTTGGELGHGFIFFQFTCDIEPVEMLVSVIDGGCLNQ